MNPDFSGTAGATPPGLPSREDLLFILEKGVLAPSADNLQPWKFETSENGVTLWLDRDRIQHFCDSGLAAPAISAGAVVENMRIAAARKGWRVQAIYFPDKEAPLKAAVIEFFRAGETASPDFNCLEKRHTNRKFYTPGWEIPRDAVSALGERAEETGAKFIWLNRKEPAYAELARIVGDADQLRFEIRRLHEEFMHILRFTPEENSSRDGLSLESLDAGPSASFMFPLIRAWKRLAFLNRFGFSRSFNFYARKQMLSSSGAGLILTSGTSVADYARGGEALQKVWHEAARRDLAFQPMEGLPIFLIDLEITGAKDLNPRQRLHLSKLRDRFYSVFPAAENRGLIMLFRAGYAPPAQSRSLRRPVESFLMDSFCREPAEKH